ncbi:MAG: uroporphyrinogen-III synthase, partial [Bacteroidota bacterium]
MQQNKITILSTRPLLASVIDEAAVHGIEINVQSFIETEAIQSVEVQQEIEQALLQSASVVFTSMNAVEAVAEFMNEEMPDWNIYCMGETTQELVKKYFGENSIAGTADNAADLAELVAEDDYIDQIIFFCGDQRRDELPDTLQNNNIEVTEIVVYHTIATPHIINRQYNGILFYSPSAVDSFFSKNKPGKQTTFFAIGHTTAGAIKKHSANSIIISDKPGKENLVEKAINYFV